MFVYGYICYCTNEFVPEHVRVRVHLHVCEHVHDYLCVVHIYNIIYICYMKFMFTIYIYDYLHVYVHCTMYLYIVFNMLLNMFVGSLQYYLSLEKPSW